MRKKRIIAATLFVAACMIMGAGVGAVAGPAEAVAYLMTRQNPDGGFSEPGAASDPNLTSWVLLAGLAAGDSSVLSSDEGLRAMQYLAPAAVEINELKDLEICTLLLSECNINPRNVLGRDFVQLIKSFMGENGKFGKNIEEHCWGIISLKAAGEEVSVKSIDWLVKQQRADGGWGESDKVLIIDTSLAVEALVAAGEADTRILRPAMRLLREKMNPDGGFPGLSGTSDAQVTSTVIRAINAVGDDPGSGYWDFNGFSPEGFLESLQAPDGHIQFSKGVESQPALTTALAVPAMFGKHYPLKAAGLEGIDMGDGQDGAESTADSDSAVSSEGPASEGDTWSRRGDDNKSRISNTEAGHVETNSPPLRRTWTLLVICAAYGLLLGLAALAAGRLAGQRASHR